MCHDCTGTGTYIITIIHVHENNDVGHNGLYTCTYAHTLYMLYQTR